MKESNIYFVAKPTNANKDVCQDGIGTWRPSLFGLIPPKKPPKYILLSIAALIGLLNKRYYFQKELKVNGKVVSSFLSVPKFYKWPYMDSTDVQIMYVKTHPAFRGKGYIKKLISCSLSQDFKELQGKIWYVTDKANKASIATALSLGFKKVDIQH